MTQATLKPILPTQQQVDTEQDTELIPASDPRAEFISVDPQRMSGTPCFVGSRVPIKHLWDYLEGGDPLEQFFDDYEGVSREAVLGAFQMAFDKLMEGLPDGTPKR